ncbi:MAG: hypothetical protein ABR500_02045 [Dermatophilaceae bacterium]|nr:hypothetical protein [Intrasporangiaceae bacterium]
MPHTTGDDVQQSTHEESAPAGPPMLKGCDLPVAPWLPGWTPRHSLVAAVATVAGWFYFTDLALSARGPGWLVVLGLLSLATGLVAASYLPRAGERGHLPRDLCSYSPLLMLFAAGWFLTIAEGSLWGVMPPLALAAAAVLRRTTGSSTCSV